MIKNRISNVILIISFSVAISTIFILSGNKVLIFGQIHNEYNTNDNNNNNINKNVNTILSGSQQVPPVKTNATGTASFEMLDDNKTLHYQINILDVPKITGIHIHQGKIGENGDIVVNLYNNSQQNIFLKENETKISQIASNSIKIKS